MSCMSQLLHTFHPVFSYSDSPKTLQTIPHWEKKEPLPQWDTQACI